MKVENLLHSFDVSCQTRKFTRRRLLRFIRLNIHLLKDHALYGWVNRKVDANYMTDLTDYDVIRFVTWITKRTGGEVEYNQSVFQG